MNKPNKEDFKQIISLMTGDATKNSKMKIGISTQKIFMVSSRNELILEFNHSNKEIIIRSMLINHKRRGIGSYIIDFLKKYAREKGYEKVSMIDVKFTDVEKFAKKHEFEDMLTVDYRFEYKLPTEALEDVS